MAQEESVDRRTIGVHCPYMPQLRPLLTKGNAKSVRVHAKWNERTCTSEVNTALRQYYQRVESAIDAMILKTCRKKP